ncbi:MAG: Rrf2 family transcriptional regulator [Candidatus Acetothermia bacterium]|jgi:Rrf2 family protein|nr:Rrf2 family transcriptional regulator [Candidatus Acetothermia bacterium]MDH7504670.1 Rrf2 family transcriptional regulator [Candidatus Acetothermia bacterium]
MKLSKKGEYALRALMDLAFHYGNGVEPSQEIAENGQIPKSFLEQILIALKNGGILESRRGPEGGYQLKRPPEEITLGEVIRLIDSPLAPFHDAQRLRELVKREGRYRGLYSVILDVRNAVAEILDKTTLADLCRRSGRSQ